MEKSKDFLKMLSFLGKMYYNVVRVFKNLYPFYTKVEEGEKDGKEKEDYK